MVFHIKIFGSQAIKAFNTLLTQNSRSRDEIDNLRVERERFEQLHSKLEKELSTLRQDISEVIENSTQAYDQRLGFSIQTSISKAKK
jgi:hypothetical protein